MLYRTRVQRSWSSARAKFLKTRRRNWASKYLAKLCSPLDLGMPILPAQSGGDVATGESNLVNRSTPPKRKRPLKGQDPGRRFRGRFRFGRWHDPDWTISVATSFVSLRSSFVSVRPFVSMQRHFSDSILQRSLKSA